MSKAHQVAFNTRPQPRELSDITTLVSAVMNAS